MRSKWEDKGNEGFDDLVTITESELRSLKRGARLGLISIFLALAAVGVAGWAWFQGTRQSSGSDLVTATEQSLPAAAAPAAVAPTNSAPSRSSAEPAPVTAAPSDSGSAP